MYILWLTAVVLVVAGGVLADRQQIYAEGRHYPDRHTEEQILNEIVAKYNNHHEGHGEDNVELELAPESNEESAEPSETVGKVEEKPRDIKKSGQKEYTSFVEVVPAQSARQLAPVLTEDKRAAIAEGDNRQTGSHATAVEMGNFVFLTVVSVCTVAATFGVVVAGVFWYKIHKQSEAAEETDYPNYGVIGPTKDKKSKTRAEQAQGDASMAYGAQLHHYQQTKQKIISMEQSESGRAGAGHESEDSEPEGDEGDFSVYECPGLAPTGDIEVNNPLFDGDKASPKPTVTD